MGKQAVAGEGARGHTLLSPNRWRAVAQSLRLSEREFQIVQCMFDDEIEAEIARRLKMSPHTVHTHLERLYRKMDVHSGRAVVLRVFREYVALNSSETASIQKVREDGQVRRGRGSSTR